MYYNPYFSGSTTPVYSPGFMPRVDDQPIIDAILRGISREASVMDLYQRLANNAPNQKHKTDILNALEGKRAQLGQFTNLYTQLTGVNPTYQTNKVPFNSYKDGLQKAYQIEVEGYEDYQRSSLLSHNPQIKNIFLWALTGEQATASRVHSLRQDVLQDYGPDPFVIDINKATLQNNTFRTALWTGKHFQITLMSINPGEDIGLENHPNLDQFLRIEQGQGIVQMGDRKDQLDFKREVFDDYSVVIPAGKWHNLYNTGNVPLKLYSIYAPPQHPYGTVHKTKAEAMAAEEHHQ